MIKEWINIAVVSFTSHYRGPYSRIEDYGLEVSITFEFSRAENVGLNKLLGD